MPLSSIGCKPWIYIIVNGMTKNTRSSVSVSHYRVDITILTILPGNFILGNYKQALGIITDYGLEVDSFKLRKLLSDADIENWIVEERKFLLQLKKEPDERVLQCAYVDALEQLLKAESVLSFIVVFNILIRFQCALDSHLRSLCRHAPRSC